MSAVRDEVLVTAALCMALVDRNATDDLIHHTDRGSQYTADDYLALLASRGISVSMSRKGDPCDNAMMESFFSSLRAECTEQQLFATRSRAEAGALIGYGPEFYAMGEQVARIADQILEGVQLSDLPVETAEFFLSINLQTADAIGIDISEEILGQADNIIREEE